MLLRTPGLWVLLAIANLQMNFLAFSSSSFTSWLAADEAVLNFIPVFSFIVLLWAASLPQRERSSNFDEIIASQPHPSGRLFWSKYLAGLAGAGAILVQAFIVLALRQGALGLAPVEWNVYAIHLAALSFPGVLAAYCLGFGLGQLLNRFWLGIPTAGGLFILMMSLSQSLPGNGHFLAGILSPQTLMVNRNYSPALGWSVEGQLVGYSTMFHVGFGLSFCFLALLVLGICQRRLPGRQKLKVCTGILLALSIALTGVIGYGGELSRRRQEYKAELETLETIDRLELDVRPQPMPVTLTHADLDIELITAEKSLRGTAAMEIINTSPADVGVIPISLRRNFTISKLTVNGSSMAIPERDADFFNLFLSTPLPPGQSITVVIAWSGKVWHWRHGFGDGVLDLAWFISEKAALLPMDYGWHPQLGRQLYSFNDHTSYLPGNPLMIIDNQPLTAFSAYSLTVSSDSPVPVAANLSMAGQERQGERWITNYAGERVPGCVLAAGPYQWLEGKTVSGWFEKGYASAFAALDQLNLEILESLEQIMPPLQKKQLILQLPHSPRSQSWQQPGSLVILNQNTAARLTVGGQINRNDVEQFLDLWWQGEDIIHSALRIDLQNWLTDYALKYRDEGRYTSAREAHREFYRRYMESNGKDQYQPDPNLIRNPDINSTRMWLAMDNTLREEGISSLAETIAWVLPLTEIDDFDNYMMVADFLSSKVDE